MYIDSPVQEDDVDCNNDDEEDDDNYSKKYTNIDDREDNKEESDDSMASDASSGPSHQQKRVNAESTHSNIPSTSKPGKVDQFRKFFSFKKDNEKKSGETSTKYKHRNDAQKKHYK